MQELRNLQDEFEAGANKFPGMTHVVMKWPKGSPKPPLPKGLPKHAELAYDDDNLCEIHSIPFGNYRSMIFSPENSTDFIEADVDISHWTIRPHDKSWDRRAAICRLKILSENAIQIYERLKQPLNPSIPSSLDTNGTLYLTERWLLKLHELRTPKILDGKILKLFYTEATGKEYPEIYRFLPWCSILCDVFLESALVCKDILRKVGGTEAQLSAATGDAIELDLTDWNKNDNYDLLIKIIGDGERSGIKVARRKKLYVLRDRLKKATEQTGVQAYTQFAKSLKYESGKIKTTIDFPLVVVKTRK